jgi:hypothetical protein
MRQLLAIAALVTLCPGAARAQTVDEIVARHIEARGGYERIKAIQTIRITRTVATPFSNVKVVISKKRPQLYRADQTVPGQPPTPRAVNAEAAWDTAQGKVVLRPADAAAETREIDGDFDGLLVDWKAKGHTVVLEGQEPISGNNTYKLKLTTKSGVVRYVYLDAQTFLDRRHTGVLKAPGRQEQFVMDFSNWRPIEGVLFPMNLDEDRTGRGITQSYATYTEKIELNVPLEDALFATPSGAGG